MQQFCKEHNVEKKTTRPYHPQTNGLCERVNQTVKIRAAKEEAEWDTILHEIAFSINTQPQASTKFTPFFLMFGRHPNLEIKVRLMTKFGKPK